MGGGGLLRARGILFDMDGTLVDSILGVERMWEAFAVRHGVNPRELIEFAHGRRLLETVEHFASADSDISAELEELRTLELESASETIEIPGAAAFVRALPQDRLALVTSAVGDLAAARMAAAGVPLPIVVIAAEDVATGKPDPEGYLAAATRLGLEPSDVVVFEDATAGVEAATAAGMRVVVVGNRPVEGEILTRIRDYGDLRSCKLVDGEISFHLG